MDVSDGWKRRDEVRDEVSKILKGLGIMKEKQMMQMMMNGQMDG